MKPSDGGKGSGRRPNEIPDEQVKSNWDSIFGLSPLERKKREQALQKMVEENERLGLYDDPVAKEFDEKVVMKKEFYE